MKNLIIASVLVLGTITLSSKFVSAQPSGCYYNGRLYPINYRIGDYICTPYGWQRIY